MDKNIANKKMGRPTNSLKNLGYRIRLSKEEFEKLEKCCEKSGLKKSEVFRKSIDLFYDYLK